MPVLRPHAEICSAGKLVRQADPCRLVSSFLDPAGNAERDADRRRKGRKPLLPGPLQHAAAKSNSTSSSTPLRNQFYHLQHAPATLNSISSSTPLLGQEIEPVIPHKDNEAPRRRRRRRRRQPPPPPSQTKATNANATHATTPTNAQRRDCPRRTADAPLFISWTASRGLSSPGFRSVLRTAVAVRRTSPASAGRSVRPSLIRSRPRTSRRCSSAWAACR